MNNQQRREKILEMLTKSDKCITAKTMTEYFGVSRQVIVSDIAILRANGHAITAAKNGYSIEKKEPDGIIESIVCRHDADYTLDEFYAVIDNGGSVLNVIIEHPIYGQISAELNIETRIDADAFVLKAKASKASQLCDLTDQLHIHTIRVPSIKAYDTITAKLKELKILV